MTEHLRETKVWWGNCETCGWQSSGYANPEDVVSSCPKCDEKIELRSEWVPSYD